MVAEVILHTCSRSRSIKLDKLSTIDKHSLGEDYLYYVRNDYNPGDYTQGVTLFAFHIVKTTNCFHFLINGQRIRKDGHHPKYDRTPQGALRKALGRAGNYMNILMTKARSVHEFLEAVKGENSNRNLADLRGFANFAASVGDVDEIEPEAYRELFLQNKELPFL